MADLIVIGIILLIVGASVRYIIKEKKKGVRCIGCPSSGTCRKKHEKNGCSGC